VFQDIERKGGPWKDAVARHLAAIEASPYKDAYIRIADRPAYWIHLPDGWMSRRELLEFLDGTDDQPRNICWVLRPSPMGTVMNIDALLRRSRLQFLSWYDDPTTKGFRFNSQFAGDLSYIRSQPADRGMVPIAHAYLGYDERMGVGTAAGQRYGERSVIPTFLEEARRAGARIILTESFNEHGENSDIEASLNIEQWRDMGQERNLFRDSDGTAAPYKYLDDFRKFNGMQEWVPPEPPPCSALDPLMVQLHQSEDLPKEVRCIASTTSSDRR